MSVILSANKNHIIRRFAVSFIIAALFCLLIHVAFPTTADDYILEDYSSLTRTHAIVFDYWLNGKGEAMNYGISGHPGFLYFIACGVAWQGAKIFTEDVGNDLVRFFSNIDKFWIAQFVMAGFLFSLAVALFSLYAGRAPLLACLALVLLWLPQDAGYNVQVMYELGTGAVAPLLVVSFFLLTRALFAERDHRKICLLLFCSGCVAAFAYLNHLPQVILFLSGVAALIIKCFGQKLKTIILSIASYLGGGVLVAGFYALLFGPKNAFWFLNFHLQVAAHTGIHGQGQAGFFSVTQLVSSLKAFAQTLPTINIMIIAILVCYLCILFLGRKKYYANNFSQLSVLVLCAVLGLGTILKHYSPHYAIMTISILPLLVYELAAPFFTGPSKKKIVSAAVAAVCLLAMMPAGQRFTEQIGFLQERGRQFRALSIAIDNMEIPAGSSIFWPWGSASLDKGRIAGTLHYAWGIPLQERMDAFYTLFKERRDQTILGNAVAYGVPEKCYYLVCDSRFFSKNSESGQWHYLTHPLSETDVLIRQEEILNGETAAVTRSLAEMNDPLPREMVLIRKTEPYYNYNP